VLQHKKGEYQERCEKIRIAVSFAGNWNHLDLATWILEYGPLVFFSPINMGSNSSESVICIIMDIFPDKLKN
jgi:hypothetical protein